MATSDIRSSPTCLQLRFDASQRRDPFADQIGHINGTKKQFCADKKIWVVLTPQESSTVPKGVLDSCHRCIHCLNSVETPADKERALLVGQCKGLLRSEKV